MDKIKGLKRYKNGYTEFQYLELEGFHSIQVRQVSDATLLVSYNDGYKDLRIKYCGHEDVQDVILEMIADE